jgi:hypothetical protein
MDKTFSTSISAAGSAVLEGWRADDEIVGEYGDHPLGAFLTSLSCYSASHPDSFFVTASMVEEVGESLVNESSAIENLTFFVKNELDDWLDEINKESIKDYCESISDSVIAWLFTFSPLTQSTDRVDVLRAITKNVKSSPFDEISRSSNWRQEFYQFIIKVREL